MGDAAHMAMGMALIAPIAGASATATAAFFASDPDDSVVVLLLFSGAEEPRGCWPVVAGRYLGFSLLVLAGLLGIGGLLQLQSGSFDDRPAAVLAAGTPRPGDLLHPMHGPPMASLFQRLRAVLLALARGALNPGWPPRLRPPPFPARPLPPARISRPPSRPAAIPSGRPTCWSWRMPWPCQTNAPGSATPRPTGWGCSPAARRIPPARPPATTCRPPATRPMTTTSWWPSWLP